jgi:hypothetical protein
MMRNVEVEARSSGKKKQQKAAANNVREYKGKYPNAHLAVKPETLDSRQRLAPEVLLVGGGGTGMTEVR